MNEDYFVHIIGRSDALPISQQDYEAIRRSITGEVASGFFSTIVDSKTTYLFPTRSISMDDVP